MKIYRGTLMMAAAVCAVHAQPQAAYKYTVKGDEKTVNITNVGYELAGKDLVLRKVTRSKQVIGDIGMQAQTTTEAWKLGTDLKQKPLYSVTVEGTESRTVENEIFVVSRGLEEVEWWSVYRVADGSHLFDTYVPLLKFSTSKQEMNLRYVGLEVPEDNAKDKRFNDPHVVGVITYASEAKVIKEAMITCDNPKLGAQLRSYADEERTVTRTGGPKTQMLRIAFSQSYPAAPNTIAVLIPILNDDLDLVHATLPPRTHITVFKR